MAYDGSITLATKVDTDGIKNSKKDVKNAVEEVGQGFKKMGGILSRALAEGNTKTAQLANNFQKASAEVEKQTAKVDELKAHLAQLKSGEITVKDTGIRKLQSDFDKACASVEKTQAEIDSLYLQLEQLQANAFRAPDTGEVVLTGKEQAEFDRLNAKLDELEPRLEQNKQKAKEMGDALKNAAGSATQAEIDKTKAKLSEAEKKLQNLQVKAEIAGQKLDSGMARAENSVLQVSSGFGKMGTKLFQLARGALVFSAITKGFTMLRQSLGSALMSNKGFRQSLYQLQAAFWTAFAPIYDYVLPAVKALVNWITSAMIAIGKFIAMLTGKSYSSMVDNGKKLQQQAAAYKSVGAGGEKAAKGMKKATEEAKKQLAVFDELNILSQDKASADTDLGGSGGAAGGGVGEGFDSLNNGVQEVTDTLSQITAIAGGFMLALGIILVCAGMYGVGIPLLALGALTLTSVIAVNWNTANEKLRTTLTLITSAVGGFALAIGAMLTFSGASVGLGIALIALGAASIVSAIGLNWGCPGRLKSTIEIVTGIVSGALLGLGALLAFSGVNISLGITLMALGAVTLAGVIALNWNALSDETKNTVSIIDAIASAALLVLGIILVCAGVNLPLGIALLAAGAVGLASAVMINWNFIKNSISNFIKENAALIVGVGTALLVLGVILVMSGVAFPLGIGLIAAGAAGLATEAALNWDYIKTKTVAFLDDNKGLIIGVSSAMLVLGIILLFTGVGIPLALGLIVAGGGILAGELVANWGFITDKIAEIWGNVKQFWNAHIAKYFTAEWWGDLAKGAINGFIRWFINGLNKLIEKINGFGFNMPDILGGGHIGFNIPTLKIPQLARGGIVPTATLAQIGEAGREAVLPLENNTEWMDMLADRLAARMGAADSSQPIILMLDGREVGRTFGKAIQDESRRTGASFVKPKIVFG